MNQALPKSHFCMKICKVPNLHQQETQKAHTAHPDSYHMPEMSVKLKFLSKRTTVLPSAGGFEFCFLFVFIRLLSKVQLLNYLC